MNKKLKIFLFIVATALVAGLLVWNYVNKASDDFADKKVDAAFSFEQLIDKTANDTSSLSQLKDKLVGLNGTIKKMNKETNSITLEIGDTTSMSSVICQIDPRYLESFSKIHEGEQIKIKGKLTGFTIDTELGLGNTVEMNFCTLDKQ